MKNTKKRDNRCTINFKKKHQIWTTINEHWKQSKNFWNNDYSPPCRRPSSPQTCSTSACHRRCHQGPGKPALTARRCLFLTKTRTQANTKTNTNIKTKGQGNQPKPVTGVFFDKDTNAGEYKDKYKYKDRTKGQGQQPQVRTCVSSWQRQRQIYFWSHCNWWWRVSII